MFASILVKACVKRALHKGDLHCQRYTAKRAILVASKAQASVYEYILFFPIVASHVTPSLLCLAGLTSLQ